eukprot:443925-Hanusia_phi.AAC.1
MSESPCPFLVSLFDGYYDPKEDATFLVLEFCHFGALDNLIEKKGAPEEDVEHDDDDDDFGDDDFG